MYLEQLKKAIEYAEENLSFNKMNVVKQADNVCVFGTGKYFEDVFVPRNLKEELKVNLLCDNNPEKWGKTIEGIKCVSPNELKNYDNLIVLILVGNPLPIYKQLTDMGINCFSYASVYMDMSTGMRKELDWFVKEKEDIEKAFKLFEDEESKKLYVNGLCNCIAPKLSKCNWDELFTNDEEYFSRNYFSLSDNEVYVDCGAYIGDSVIDFCKAVDNKYDKIFAFELDKGNFEQMRKNVTGENITLYNYGVWNENSELEYGTGYSDNEPTDGMCIYKTNNVQKAYVKKLDDILDGERVTFIKMDIEGCEVEALKGAENIIRTQKPKLAICVYHKTSDYWQVPILLKKFNKDYKFTLKHHYSTDFFETILYAQ